MTQTEPPGQRWIMEGWCPACRSPATFVAEHAWYRDHLRCEHCGSLPRERALALVLEERFPKWWRLRIHESSPVPRGVSRRLADTCRRYVATYNRPEHPAGAMILGHRNENLEAQTFADASFDLVVTLDVMEHVNEPQRCFSEIWRTLATGGAYLFTAPTYKDSVRTERAARVFPDGHVEHFRDPEYHGDPTNPAGGALVTFRFGYDLPELIRGWAPFDVRVYRFHDHRHAVLGEFTEVYLCEKRPAAVI